MRHIFRRWPPGARCASGRGRRPGAGTRGRTAPRCPRTTCAGTRSSEPEGHGPVADVEQCGHCPAGRCDPATARQGSGTRDHDQEDHQCGKEPTHSPYIEGIEVDAARSVVLAQQDAGDEVAGQREEHADAGGARRADARKHVRDEHEQDRDAPDAVECGHAGAKIPHDRGPYVSVCRAVRRFPGGPAVNRPPRGDACRLLVEDFAFPLADALASLDSGCPLPPATRSP